jgi:hypothetical protein
MGESKLLFVAGLIEKGELRIRNVESATFVVGLFQESQGIPAV